VLKAGVTTAREEHHMTVRRRRWLRRLAIGVSVAAFAAPAAARPDEGGTGVAPQQTAAVRPDDRADRFTRVQPTLVASNAVRPDDRADRFTGVRPTLVASNAVRPDDRADRFAISDGFSTATPQSTDSSVSWDGAVKLGLGALVLVLALGLGIGYIRRPRIAGI
jgi:hypothetical protein